MEAKKHDKYLILWSVIDCDEDENRVSLFQRPFQGRGFCAGKLLYRSADDFMQAGVEGQNERLTGMAPASWRRKDIHKRLRFCAK